MNQLAVDQNLQLLDWYATERYIKYEWNFK